MPDWTCQGAASNEECKIENVKSSGAAIRTRAPHAIEWVMERYQVTTNKDSGIVNDPNKWVLSQSWGWADQR